MRGIAIREQLTDEWEQTGIKEQKEYAILTAEISEATFGVKPSEHKKLKSIKKENLRDHINDLELIFSMPGEASTTEIAIQRDAQGFDENQEALLVLLLRIAVQNFTFEAISAVSTKFIQIT